MRIASAEDRYGQAKKRRQDGGPYVATAVFCEKVLQERDGVVSLIRIVDRMTVTMIPGQSPPPFVLTAAIIIKAGFMRGSYKLTLRQRTPSGSPTPDLLIPILFEGEDRGVGVFAQVNFSNLEEGLHWFDLRLEGQLLSSMPLRLIQRSVILQGTSPPES
jgi:hypothetical protein